jgi:hypothetical protein
MSEFSRRDLLQRIALSITAGGLSLEAAQHVHSVATQEKTANGAYKPKALNAHDLLASQNPELLAIYTGGVAWLDHTMQPRATADFLGATADQQTALLDLIAYRKNESPELGPGIKFFDWARKMVVDAYYTSPIGIKDLGYMGNTALSKFEVPQEAIDYALKRSPV